MACSICGRLSADGDHLDCTQMRKLYSDTRKAEPATDGEMGPELRALLLHMGKK